jgi:hypothetical protein
MLIEVIMNFFYSKWSICKKISTTSRNRLGWTPGPTLTFSRNINSLGFMIQTVPFRHRICSWDSITKTLVER